MIRSAFRSLVASVAALAVLAPSLALAGPVAYINTPLDTVQATVNAAIANVNSAVPTAQPYQTVTGAAGAATLNGVKGTITTEALATAAGSVYTETLTDSSIQANSIIVATTGWGTATTGSPVIFSVVPGAGSAVIKIQNVSAAALNGTITISFMVIN